MKRGMISSILDVLSCVQFNDVVMMYSILRVMCRGVIPDLLDDIRSVLSIA